VADPSPSDSQAAPVAAAGNCLALEEVGADPFPSDSRAVPVAAVGNCLVPEAVGADPFPSDLPAAPVVGREHSLAPEAEVDPFQLDWKDCDHCLCYPGSVGHSGASSPEVDRIAAAAEEASGLHLGWPPRDALTLKQEAAQRQGGPNRQYSPFAAPLEFVGLRERSLLRAAEAEHCFARPPVLLRTPRAARRSRRRSPVDSRR